MGGIHRGSRGCRGRRGVGYLTLASNKRSKDTQQRATLIAALDDTGEDHPVGAVKPGGGVAVFHKAGETWLLANQGSGAIRVSSIEGLTDLDKKRLTSVAPEPKVLNPGDAREFVLVSRYTLSGPANVVVTFTSESLGVEFRRILQVPAP